MDTIFAQSSKIGKAGISVFRLSGPSSLEIVTKLLSKPETLTPRVMYFRKLLTPINRPLQKLACEDEMLGDLGAENRSVFNIHEDSSTKSTQQLASQVEFPERSNRELIDHAMIVYFQAGASVTGEDLVEIHTHGSLAVAAILTKSILSFDEVRMAEPGEFTKRSFLNGKCDLTAVEGLADLIEAETEKQHRQAIRQMDGELDRLYESWRQKLLSIRSLLEAFIDFPEEDIPDEVLAEAELTIKSLKLSISQHLDDNRRGERLRQGIKLSILGAPNVGKSSLLNFLMQREVAIVSNIAGTTRDIIEGHLDIGGYPIILQDTAGIRQGSEDIIEQEGMRRALLAASGADIRILMTDASSTVDSLPDEIRQLIDDQTTILLVNKVDLGEFVKLPYEKAIYISLKDKIGLDNLLKKIEEIASLVADPGEHPLITRQRHRRQLQDAISNLERVDLANDIVLVAEDIRLASRSLSTISGKITVEEILGEIFSKFCIGK
jgi:tRNA modification GTPase